MKVSDCAVVHVAVVRAHAPERRRPQLVARRRAAVLDDAVAGADVVQQEVAERVDRLVAERGRDVNAPPLMTVPAGAVVIERVWQMLQPIASNSCDPALASAVAATDGVARRRFRRAHERRELVDVVVGVLRIGARVERERRSCRSTCSRSAAAGW